MLKYSTRRRRRIRVLLFGALGVLVLLGALPGWLPWILPTLAQRWGATYTQYSRRGYGRFELGGLTVATGSGRFRAERVEAYVPTVWLWRRVWGPKPEPVVRVTTWSWESAAPAKPSAAAPPAFASFQKAQAGAATLRRWLPAAELNGGTIRIKDQTVAIPRAVWAEGKLSAMVVGPRPGFSGTLQVVADVQGPMKFSLDAGELAVRSDFSIAESGGGLAVEGTTFWLSNRLELKAAFSRTGRLPETASVCADAFEIPASLLALEGFGNLGGSLRLDWSRNRFALELKASAPARQDDRPPIALEVRCSGDAGSAQIDRARISTPWLGAELSGPTALFFEPPFLPQSVALILTADLDRQPWFAAGGKLAGQAVLHPSRSRFPEVDFQLAGAGVVVSNVVTKTVRLEGRLDWPRIELARAAVEMADGSTLLLRGKGDLRKRIVEAGRLDFTGGYGREFLPPGVSFKSATLAADFSGPPGALTNSAKLEVEELSLPPVGPMRLEAGWSGLGLRTGQIQLALAAGDSQLRLRGSADLAAARKTLEVSALELGRSNRVEVRLQQPFQLTWQVGGATNPPTLALQPVRCAGEGRRLEVEAQATWPQRGSLRVLAEGLDGALIRDFLQVKLPVAKLERLAFDAGWSNGPVVFQLESRTGFKAEGVSAFTAETRLAGGGEGLAIERFSVFSATQTVCQAQGVLPVEIRPGDTNGLMQIRRDAPLRLHLATEPNTAFWEEIAGLSGVRLQQPDLQADLDGTWARPSGRIALRSQRVEFPKIERPLPTLRDLELLFEASPETARLSRLNALVESQPVELTAEMPLAAAFWDDPVRRERWPDWRTVSARLKIGDAQLARFSGFLPALLVPEGKARVDLELKPGGLLEGQIVLKGAGTRPLGEFGAIRDIQAVMIFTNHGVRLTNLSADIGGHQLIAWGRAALDEARPPLAWLREPGPLPPFELHLRGTNLPLVRRPSLILRADADLLVTNDAAAPPLITGTMTLRDGLYLADLNSLVPEKAASPAKRPPYFSVATEPWSDWRLQVAVTGEGFLRVQTPLFRGRLSTTFQLTHTLKDPLALGEVRIQSGTVTFPFGSLEVKRGFATLTSDDPYHPRLDILAGALRYGHEVKLEVGGPADSPLVQFSSSPPLSSEQILLMLSTGQLPAGVGTSSTAGQRARGLALFAGKNFLAQLGIGSDQEQLSLRTGEQISDTGRATYEVEYKLGQRVSLMGGYDRFDQYNLNLKWRVYSK